MKQRGGKREGAGRKKRLFKATQIRIYLNNEDVEKVKKYALSLENRYK